MKTQAIIVAAGIGERLGLSVCKALVPLNGKPLFVHAIEPFVGLEEDFVWSEQTRPLLRDYNLRDIGI